MILRGLVATLLTIAVYASDQRSRNGAANEALMGQDFFALDEAIRLHPKDHMAYFKRATANLMAGRDSQALQDLTSVLGLQPDFEPALYYRARTWLHRGRPDKAREDTKHCKAQRCREIEAQANHLEYCEKSAVQAADSGDFGSCIEYASDGLGTASRSLKLRRERFRCFLGEGRVLEALADLREVVQIDKADTKAVTQLAKAEFLLENHQQMALKLLQRCVRYDSEATNCVKTSKMLRALQKELEQPPLKINMKKIEQMITDEMSTMGMPGEFVESSLLLDSIRRKRCAVHAKHGRWDKAAVDCARVRDMDPEFEPAIIVQAHLDMQAGNLQAARTLVHDRLAAGSDNPKLKELYAEIQALMQQQQQQQWEQFHQRQQGGQAAGGANDGKDLYNILGVDKTASQKEIKKAYRELSKKYHPDKYRGGDLSADEAMAKMQEINSAYETLSNEDQRREYDSFSSGGGQGGGMPFGGGGRPGGGHPGGGMPFGGDDMQAEMLRQMFQQFGGGGNGNFKVKFN